MRTNDTTTTMTRQQRAGLAHLMTVEGRMPEAHDALTTGLHGNVLRGLRRAGLITCSAVFTRGRVSTDFAITEAGREAAFANACAEDTRESNGLLVGRRKAAPPAPRTALAAKRAARALARRLGVVIHEARDRENLEHEITVDAPAGHVWSSSAVHELVCAGADGTPLDDLWIDLAERMAYGVEACDDADCDVCGDGGAR